MKNKLLPNDFTIKKELIWQKFIFHFPGLIPGTKNGVFRYVNKSCFFLNFKSHFASWIRLFTNNKWKTMSVNLWSYEISWRNWLRLASAAYQNWRLISVSCVSRSQTTRITIIIFTAQIARQRIIRSIWFLREKKTLIFCKNSQMYSKSKIGRF